MSKFSDAVKGFVNKHFTQEVTCSHCGKTGKIMFFSTLKDGNQLCSSCKNEIPEQFNFKVKESTLEKFKELYGFMQYTKTNLEPIFKPTADYSYGEFKVDAIHNLCRVGDSFVFEISNIAAYKFDFQPEEFKEGFTSKAKGNVYLTGLILKHPVATFETTAIKYGAKAKADKPLFSKTFIYENPEDMDAFVAKFDALWDKFDAAEKEKEFNDLVEQNAKELLKQKELEGNS